MASKLATAVLILLVLALGPAWGQTQQGDVRAERDRRYEQRFDQQDHALAAAVLAIKEATAAALAAQDKQTSAQFTATKEAVTKAEAAAEKRFDSVNEFRNTLKDQQGKFVDKSEIEIRFKALSERIDEVSRLARDNTLRSEGSATTWSFIAAALGLVFGAFAAFAAVTRVNYRFNPPHDKT